MTLFKGSKIKHPEREGIFEITGFTMTHYFAKDKNGVVYRFKRGIVIPFDEPATGRQLQTIAQLEQKHKIPEPRRERHFTKGKAGQHIRNLSRKDMTKAWYKKR